MTNLTKLILAISLMVALSAALGGCVSAQTDETPFRPEVNIDPCAVMIFNGATGLEVVEPLLETAAIAKLAGDGQPGTDVGFAAALRAVQEARASVEGSEGQPGEVNPPGGSLTRMAGAKTGSRSLGGVAIHINIGQNMDKKAETDAAQRGESQLEAGANVNSPGGAVTPGKQPDPAGTVPGDEELAAELDLAKESLKETKSQLAIVLDELAKMKAALAAGGVN